VRFLKTLVAAGAIGAVAAAVMSAPAMAEPINPHTHKQVTPNAWDIVGVGSQSIAYITDQLTYNYDCYGNAKKQSGKCTTKKDSPANPYIYSWDGVPPSNLNDTTSSITAKRGCKKNLRPDGSSAGITALETNSLGNTSYTYKHKKHTVACVSFARSSRPRGATDAPAAKGGIAFDTLWADAVSYASTNIKGETTNVPNNLSRAQLIEIFSCSVPAANGDPANTWGALLGSKAKPGSATQAIDPIAPQAGSGTLSFWMETALGLSSTAEPTCGTAAGLSVAQQPEENEGISPVFRIGGVASGKPNPNVIYPYSVGAFVAEKYHSAGCSKHASHKGKNMFGCAETGVLGLNGISGVAPTVTKKGAKFPVTNPKWVSTKFERELYVVVPYSTDGKTDHMSSSLDKYFGPKGYFCKQTSVIKNYGFESDPHCGSIG
jgi:ABC-type phosphate transport system substrate-binding protein